MSVIIRLQNLPWSANAMDIRQFFKGLSIPEGGVHIVGGEMGDAFIAFSTDEDARQAMMHDRDKINEVQVRLLLSSRAEMQKVIETARQQSMLALQNATTGTTAALPKATTALAASTPVAVPAAAAVLPGAAASLQMAPVVRVIPQPPVITANSLQKILGTHLNAAPSFLAYQQQAGITYTERSLDSSDSPDSRRNSSERRRRSDSRSPSYERTSRRRDRRERSDHSRSRSREQDYKSRRLRRSRSRDRSRERSRSRERNGHRNSGGGGAGRSSRNNSREHEDSGGAVGRPKPGSINPWNIPPAMGAATGRGVVGAGAAVAVAGAGGGGGGGGYHMNPLSAATPTNGNPFAAVAAGGGGGGGGGNAASTNPNNPFAQTTAAAAASGLVPNAALLAAISSLANATAAKATAGNAPANPLAMMPAFQSAVVNSCNVGIFGNATPNAAAVIAATTASAEFGGGGVGGGGKQPDALQNPYAVAANPNLMNVNSNLLSRRPSSVGAPDLTQAQKPIAFASTNPYAQMYPTLFAAQGVGAAGGGEKPSLPPQRNAPFEQGAKQQYGRGGAGGGGAGGGIGITDSGEKAEDNCCVKVSNICSTVSYSDLRRFFYGLYIPHNGIKMVNDRHGLRVGVAFIQFTRHVHVKLAMARNNVMLKSKVVRVEPVAESEFLSAEDSYRPLNRNSSVDDRRGLASDANEDDDEDAAAKEQLPFSVLFVKEIPGFATEQDVMKMFSAYTIIDILLTPSPDNRRENIAYVRFSRDAEAKLALANEACHIITHRKVRVTAGSVEDMDRAKEKLRLANEQLLKEERAMAEQEEAARKAAEAAAAAEKQAGGDGSGVVTVDAGDVDSGTDDQMVIATDDEYQQQPQKQQRQQRGGMRDPRQRRNSRFDSIPSQQANDNNNDCMPLSAQMPLPMAVMPNHSNNNNNNNGGNNNNNMNNSNANFNMMNAMPPPPATDEERFVIMKNCVYNTRMNDIGDLLNTSNLRPNHVELLRNERNLPSGEFIVEFRDAIDADIAIKDFNNTQFRGRNLRVYTIRPQQIADRLGKPFMNYFPGGSGGGGSDGNGSGYGPQSNGPNMMMSGGGGGGMRGGNGGNGGGGGGGPFNNGGNSRGRNNNSNNRRNRRGGRGNSGKSHNNPFDNDADDDINNGSNDDDNDSNDGKGNNRINDANDADDRGPNNNDDGNGSGGGGGGGGGGDIPPKFNQPGCVIAMENVPFRADLKAIMRFFNEFDLTPDDIIRRFNDNGTPTGDARVAFRTPDEARAAFDAKKRKHIFNRTVYLRLL